jgi:hypothetical protein
MGVPSAIPRTLLADDVLHRVLMNAKQAADLHEAFMLRRDEKDSGLSVNFDCTADEARTNGTAFRKTYGAASLLTGAVTELKLRVEPDEPQHANIIGIPYKEDDEAKAEWFASQPASRVTKVVKELWKRP